MKVQAYLAAEICLRLYDVIGLVTGPAVSWRTGRQPSATPTPAFDNDFFVGIEWSFEFSTIEGDRNLGTVAAGLTQMVSFTKDPCQSAAPPAPGPPPG